MKMRFALLVLYAAGTLAVPVPDERIPKATISVLDCGNTRFQPGTEFLYEYAAQTVNQVEGASKQSTGLTILSRASIVQGNDCQFKMKLQDSELDTRSMTARSTTMDPRSNLFKEDIEKYVIFFTMRNNRIVNVIPEAGETTEALNIKRGILSTLQLDETATTETDVNGMCATEITKADGKIIKSKTLSDCTERAVSDIGLESSPLNKQLKPLSSKSVCAYEVDRGTVRTADCMETHMFKPFSGGYQTPAGALTTVAQKMRFVGYNYEVKPNSVLSRSTEPKSLIFDHTPKEMKADTINDQVEEVLARLVDQSGLSLKQTVGNDFTKLVRLLRKMNTVEMTRFWNKYFDCIKSKVCKTNNLKDLYRQYMLDAISYCGSSSCISAVKTATIEGDVSGDRANVFLQSIAFVAQTTDGIIEDVLQLAEHGIRTGQPSRQAFLTLGTLISRHCAKSSANCKSAGSKRGQMFLVRMLNNCDKMEDYRRVEEILMAIKGIGNAKQPESVRPTLIQCALKSTHSNITIAAFDALRGMRCQDATLRELTKVVKDTTIDVEKRIHAFRASIKCPTYTNLEALVGVYMAADPSEQVASYMWSYLSNLNESSSPENAKVKEYLAAITKGEPLKEPETSTYTLTSRNFDKSLYIDSIKSGVGARGNLIFNSQDILPKTATLDMTAKVMGVPVDLVETVVGVDGVETLLENMDIPSLDFNIFKLNLADKWRQLQEKKEVMDRVRREVGTPEDKQKQLSGFVTLKVMGQEVRIMSYDDIQAMVEDVDNMNVIDLMTKIAHGGEKTFTKSMMFMEMTHTVPTGFGLPLRMKLVGSTVGSLQLKGKLDMRNMFWGRGALAINGIVKPSAVVDISGQIGIESNYVSTGLKVSSNMVLSNMLKGSVNYKAGQILQVNVDTPTEALQLVKTSSTPYMYMNAQTDILEGVERMVDTNKCAKSKLIGLGVCTSVRVPLAFRDYEAPYFPLTGPSHFALSLVRGDEKLDTFQFKMALTRSPGGVLGDLEVSTPGATIERRMSGKVMYADTDDKKVLRFSAEPLANGRSTSLELSYDAVSKSASIQARNNFLFNKEMIATLAFQNQTNKISTQYGIVSSLKYASYKMEHVTKYVNKPTGHMVVSKTTYAPNKYLSSSLEVNTVDNKVTYNLGLNQFQQSLEVTGTYGEVSGAQGVRLVAVHKPSMKNVSAFAGFKTESSNKELVTSLTVGSNVATGSLILNAADRAFKGELDVNGKNASVSGAIGRDGGYVKVDVLGRVSIFDAVRTNNALILGADVVGKKARTEFSYHSTGVDTQLVMDVNVLGKTAKLDAMLSNADDKKSLELVGTVLGKKSSVLFGYNGDKDTKSVAVDVRAMGVKKAGVYAILSRVEHTSLKVGATVLDKDFNINTIVRNGKDIRDVVTVQLNIAGKQASANFAVANTEAEKSVGIRVDASGENAIATMGYFKEDKSEALKISFNGGRSEVFVRMENEGSRTSAGIKVGEFTGGVRAVGKETGVCTSLYYKKTAEEKDAIMGCVELKDLSDETKSEKQIVYTVEMPELKKKLQLVNDFKQKSGLFAIGGQMVYNEVVVASEELRVDYMDFPSSSVRHSVVVGKYNMDTTLSLRKELRGYDLGLHVQAMSKSLSLSTKYTYANEKEVQTWKLTSALSLDGKPVPVGSEVSVEIGGNSLGASLTLRGGAYSASVSDIVSYGDGKFEHILTHKVLRDEKNVYKILHRIQAFQSAVKLVFGQQVEITLSDKKPSQYGIDLTWDKLSEQEQVLGAYLLYATGKRSSIIVQLANTPEVRSMKVKVDYLAGRSIQHIFKYTKAERQVDAKVEFLPKMFASFMGKLETKDGLRLVTASSVSWKGSKKMAVKVQSGYVNNAEMLQLFARVNDNTRAVVQYTKTTPRVAVDVTVAGKSLIKVDKDVKALDVEKVMTTVLKPLQDMDLSTVDFAAPLLMVKDAEAQLRVDLAKLWSRVKEMDVDLTEIQNMLKRLDIAIQKVLKEMENKFVQFVAYLNTLEMEKLIELKNRMILKVREIIEKIDFSGVLAKLTPTIEKLIAGVTTKMEETLKNIIELDFSRAKSRVAIDISIFKKQFFKILHNIKDYSLSIKYKTLASLSAKYDRKSKTLSLGLKTRASRYGVDVRADWKNKVVSVYGKDNNIEVVGFEAFLHENSLVVKNTLSRNLFFKTIFTITDNMLRFEVQRSQNRKVTTEFLGKYKLSKEVCQLALNWNKMRVEEVMKVLKPLIAKVKTVITIIVKDSKMAAGKAKVEFWRLVNEMDRAFDEFDFVAARDRLGKVAVRVLKEVSALNVKALKMAADAVEVLEARLNKEMENVQELIKKINMDAVMAKVNELVKASGVEEFAKKLNELIPVVQQAAATLKKDVDARVSAALEVLAIITKNLTDATKPVVLKAITLFNDFEIRGVRMEVIMNKVDEQIKVSLMKMQKEAVLRLEELRTLLETTSAELMKLKVPYTDMTATQLVEYTKTKLTELLKTVEKMNIEQIIKDVQTKLRTLKINGKSLQQYLVMGQEKMAELQKQITQIIKLLKEVALVQMPNLAQKSLEQAIRVSIRYAQQTEEYLKTVQKFAEPLAAYLATAEQSLAKNFGSWVRDVRTIVVAELQRFRVPSIKPLLVELKRVMELIAPVVKPLVPLCQNITTQISDIKMDGLSSVIRQLADMDVASPVNKAWKDADVLGLLEKCGVNAKVAVVIELLKDVNVTQIISETTSLANMLVEIVYINVYSSATDFYENVYEQLNKITQYLSSFSTKDYDAWVKELKQCAALCRSVVEKTLKDISNTADRFIKALMEMVDMDLEKLYNRGMKIADWLKTYYSNVSGKWVRVYADLKEPTIKVYVHYRDIVLNAATEQYNIVSAKLVDFWQDFSGELKKMVATVSAEVMNKATSVLSAIKELVPEKVMEMQSAVDRVYKNFLATYGNMTWEEVGAEVEKMVAQKYQALNKFLQTELKTMTTEAIVLNGKLIEKAVKIYKDIVDKVVKMAKEALADYEALATAVEANVVKMNKYVRDKYTELKPKFNELLTKYEAALRTESERLMEQGKKMYTEVESKITELYDELKSIPVKEILIDNILPALMQDMESIWNQTCRNSVIMMKEITRAYAPFVIIAKDYVEANIVPEVVRVVGYLRELAERYSFENMRKMVDETVAKVQKIIEDFRNSENVQNLIAEVRYVVKMVVEKVEALRKDPVVLRIQTDLTKISEMMKEEAIRMRSVVDDFVGEMKRVIVQQVATIMKDPTVVKTLKTVEEMVVKVKSVTRQLLKSGGFTLQKMQECITPCVESAILAATNKINQLVADFTKAPEETFWKEVQALKEFAGALDISEYAEQMIAFTKDLVIKSTDQWTKDIFNELYEKIVALAKKVGQVAKDFVETWMKYSTAMDKMVKQFIEQLKKIFGWAGIEMKNLEEFTQTLVVNVQKAWNNCTLKDLFDSIIGNEVWSELVNEVKTHEIFVLVRDLVNTVATKLSEQFTTISNDAVEMIRGIGSQLGERYAVLVKEADALFNVIKEKIGEMKMEDIVAYLEKNYAEMLKKVTTQLGNLSEKVQAVSARYVTELKSLMKMYTGQMMVVYKDMQAQLTAIYNSYRPVIAEEYNRIVAIVTEVYTKVALRAGIDFNTVSKQIVTMTKKLRDDLTEMWNQSVLRAQMTALKKMTIAETIGAVQKIPENVRVFAKSAITQIVTIIKKLSADASKSAEQLIKDVTNQLDATVVELMSDVKKAMEGCANSVRGLVKTAMDQYQPLVNKVTKTCQDMDREMKETIVFLYKYYNLQPKIDQLTKLVETRVNEIVAEGRVIVERIRKQLAQIPEIVDTLVKEYYVEATAQMKKMQAQVEDIVATVEKMLPKISSDMLKMYLAKVEAYVRAAIKRVRVFAKDGTEFTTDAVLRGVHQSLKRAAVMEKSMREAVNSLRESVRISINEKGLNIDISHLEITPSFKALLNTTKSLIIKTIRQSMQQVEFLVRQSQTDIAMLRMTVQAYAKMANEQAPIVIGKATKMIKEETAALKVMLEKFVAEFKEKWNKEYPVLVAKLTKIVKDLNKEIVSLNDLVAKKVPVIMAEVQKMIQQELARVVKVKDFAVAMIAKTSQTVESVLDRISKSKIYIKFVAQIEQKLMALRKAITQRIRAIQTNPTFIKVRSDIKKFVVKTLTNLKKNGEEFVKVAMSQAVLLKETVIKYVETIREKSPIVFAKIVEFIKTQIADAAQILSSFPEKLEKLRKEIIKAVREFVGKIMKNKEFIQTVEYIKKQVADLKTMIQKAIKDIQTNPTLIKIRQKLTAMTMKLIYALKEKSAVLVQEIQKRIAIVRAEVERLIEIIQKDTPVLVEKAMNFIKEQLAKVDEKIKSVIGDLEKLVRDMSTKVINFGKKVIQELAKLIEDKIAELKKNPTLIKIRDEIKNATIAIIAEIKTRIPEILKTVEEKVALVENMVKQYISIVKEKAPVIIKQISAMVRDTITKIKASVRSTIADIEKKIQDLYKGIVSSKSFKEAVAFAKKQLAVIKESLDKQVEMIKQRIEILKNNPTVIKIKNFIIAAMKDVKTNVMKAVQMVKKEFETLRAKVEAYTKMVREEVVALVKQLKEQLRDITEYIRSLIQSLPAKFNKLRQMIVKKVNDMIAQIKKMMMDIRERIVSSKVYQEVIAYAKKVQAFAKEMIAKIREFLKKLNIDIAQWREKVFEFVMKAQSMISERMEQILEKMTAIMKKIRTDIKNNIEMVKKELPALIKKIEKLIKDFFLKSEEFAKRTFVQVVESEQVVQLRKMLEQVRNFLRDQAKQMLNNPSMVQLRNRVDNLVKQTVYYTKQYLQVARTEVARMLSELKDLIQSTTSQLIKIARQQLKTIEMWIRENISQLLKNQMFAEVRGDLMRSFDANKNITLRIMENIKTIITPYVSQCVSLYVQMSEQVQQLPSYTTQFSRNMYESAQSAYDLVANVPSDQVYGKLMEYVQQVYNSLKSIISDLYTTLKSLSATVGKDTVDAVVASLKSLEQRLVEFTRMMEKVVEAIRTTVTNIQAGGNPQQEVTSLVKKLFGGKIDVRSALDEVCAKDTKLCRLVETSMTVHKELVDKYLQKTY